MREVTVHWSIAEGDSISVFLVDVGSDSVFDAQANSTAIITAMKEMQAYGFGKAAIQRIEVRTTATRVLKP